MGKTLKTACNSTLYGHHQSTSHDVHMQIIQEIIIFLMLADDGMMLFISI